MSNKDNINKNTSKTRIQLDNSRSSLHSASFSSMSGLDACMSFDGHV